jgi:hypothetical protein
MTTPSFSVSRMGSICWSDCGLSLATRYLFSLSMYSYSLLLRLAFEAIKHMLHVHIAGDKLRSLI